MRTLDNWLYGPVTKRNRRASDKSTGGNVEDKNQEPHPSPSNAQQPLQEPCMIISSPDDRETDDEVEGDNCPAKTDCPESEPLFIPSTSSPAIPVPIEATRIEEMDDSITEQDCYGTCCKVNMNSPFQPQSKETIGSFAKGGRNLMCKWYKLHPWLTACKERKNTFASIVSMLQIMGC